MTALNKRKREELRHEHESVSQCHQRLRGLRHEMSLHVLLLHGFHHSHRHAHPGNLWQVRDPRRRKLPRSSSFDKIASINHKERSNPRCPPTKSASPIPRPPRLALSPSSLGVKTQRSLKPSLASSPWASRTSSHVRPSQHDDAHCPPHHLVALHE